MSKLATREKIVEAADALFYEQGYEHTSFADIAKTVAISRGNFYYHFKSKDEILDAVIDVRLANTQLMLDGWEVEGSSPAERIRNFIYILKTNQDKIKRYGCPVGTLFSELAKLNHSAQEDSRSIFSLFRSWLTQQFTLLGCEEEADELAMHLLARSQGVATMANAFPDEAFLDQEVAQMCAWLEIYVARGKSKQAKRQT
ncbi:MAG: TetR/AcrR family transcriptional regulator [Proteobacteria bacterium]|nr:TetR/AcrR family transcriptional regulator [Pseudomonadota bacterium]